MSQSPEIPMPPCTLRADLPASASFLTARKHGIWAHCRWPCSRPRPRYSKLWSAGAFAIFRRWRHCLKSLSASDSDKQAVQFEEAIELEDVVELLEPLAFVLNRLLEQLCARLKARALAVNELRL